MLLLALLVAATACWYARRYFQTADTANQQAARDRAAAATGLTGANPKHLAAKFTDKAGTMLADPPAPGAMVDPATVVVAHLDDAEVDSPEVDWKAFDAFLSKEIGRPVTDLVYDSTADQLASTQTGAITVVALHPADAPFLVNQYGFHPMAVLGQEGKATGNRLDLIVPSDGKIAALADVRGHTLTCTVPSSVTGYRAAIAVLARDQNIRPFADYELDWSLKQKQSITGIADHKYEVAAVSDTKLRSMVAAGKVKADAFKVIYQSDVVPRTTIGYFYNLKPELADRICKATLDYTPTADPNDDTPSKFAPTDYKKDFEFMRAIDDRFDPRLDTKTKRPTTGPA